MERMKYINAHTIYEEIGADADEAYATMRADNGEEPDFMDGFCWTINRIQKIPEALMHCDSCRLFEKDEMCSFWHRYSRPNGYCHNWQKRKK